MAIWQFHSTYWTHSFVLSCHASLAPNDSLSQTLFSFFLVFFLSILPNYSIPKASSPGLFLHFFFLLPLEIFDDDKEEKEEFIDVTNNFAPLDPNPDHSSQQTLVTPATPASNSTGEDSDLSWVCYVCGFGFGFRFSMHLCVGGFGFLVVSVFDGWILCGCWWCLWWSILGLPLVVVMELGLGVGFIFSKQSHASKEKKSS